MCPETSFWRPNQSDTGEIRYVLNLCKQNKKKNLNTTVTYYHVFWSCTNTIIPTTSKMAPFDIKWSVMETLNRPLRDLDVFAQWLDAKYPRPTFSKLIYNILCKTLLVIFLFALIVQTPPPPPPVIQKPHLSRMYIVFHLLNCKVCSVQKSKTNNFVISITHNQY